MANNCELKKKPVLEAVGQIISESNIDYVFKLGEIEGLSLSMKSAFTTDGMRGLTKFWNAPENEHRLREIGSTALGNKTFEAYRLYSQGKQKEFQEYLDSNFGEDSKEWTKTFVEKLSKGMFDFINSLGTGTEILKDKLREAIDSYVLSEKHNNKNVGWGTLTNFMALNKGPQTSLFNFIGMFMPDVKKELLDKRTFGAALKKYFNFDISETSSFTTFNAIESLLGGQEPGEPGTTKGFASTAMKYFNKYLIINAPAMLLTATLYLPSMFMFAMTAGLATFANVYKLPKKRSTKELQLGLGALGVTNGKTGLQYYIGELMNSFSKRTGNEDYSGKNSGYRNRFANNQISGGIMMGIQNLVGDTLFRPKYMELALELAMDRLGIQGTVSSYINVVNADGTIGINESSLAVLQWEWHKALSDYIGMAYDDKGSQTTWGSLNRIYSYITQWSTRYTNNTLRNLSKGKLAGRMSDMVTAGWYDQNGAIQKIGIDLVSNQEMARERSKLAFAMKMALRYNKQFGGCEDETWLCAWNKFMGIVYLPGQASYTAHPLINQLSKLIGNTIEDNPFFDHNTSEVTKIMEAFNTFMVRPLLRAGFLADFATDTLVRNYNGDGFSTALKGAFIQKGINIAGYLSEDITDYIQGEGSYTPKNHTADDMALFGENNKGFRQSFADMSFAGKVLNTEMYGKRYGSFFNNLPVIRHFILPSENLGQIIKTMEEDVGYQTLTRGELTEDMISNPEFIKFAFANLTKDFAQFRSEFDESGVRISKYNQDEINLGEQYLKEALQGKTGVDLETYMEGIRSQLGQDAYQKVKLMIHTTPDNSKAYSDFLADYTSDSRLSGVKGLALAAEGMKKELMTSKGLRYKKEGEYSIGEQQAMADIEKQVVERLLPSLYLADRRQRHNVSMFYVIDKYDGTDGKYDIKKHFNLGKDKDGNQLEDYDNVDFLKTVDFKEGRKMDIALWAKMLGLSELSQGNADGFMLNNVITNKLNTYNPMNEKLDERQQLSRFVNTVTYLSEVMEDLNYSEMEIAHGFLPAVTQRLDQYSKLRQDANFIEAVGGVDKIEVYDNVLYKSAKTIKDVSNGLDYLDDINRFNKGYEKSTGKNPGVKGNGGYFSKSPQKDYDKYKMFYPKFLDRSSRNLQSLSKSYGQSNSYSTRTNYSDRERRFLNARPRYSNVISQRAAPDIQQGQGTFTRKTGKSKGIRGSAGGRTGWKMKVPQFVKNKIITRGEGLDRPIPAREIKDSDRRGRQTQS